ncbi:MAG: beta-N-acetylhexosaminidase [Alphaproteobacteria bacterium]|nr:beta-N-acetylhexosaminidase [Alphaproteobacteria bacterium]
MSNPKAVIYGLAGTSLTADERSFFSATDPLGFILFARNIAEPAQVRDLVASLRALIGRPDAPVLIDQEGGRVQRLKPPHWRDAPPAARFGTLYRRDPAEGLEAARLNAQLIGDDLAALGITVDCAPVLDLSFPGAHDVIGDRAYDSDPAIVAALGGAVCDGLRAAGVMPVIKHLPGHGRAMVDSHFHLPTLDESAEVLTETDLAPFRRVGGPAHADRCWAMTAHIVCRAFDASAPVTLSQRAITRVIRGAIGFEGVLVSDDVSMQALQGTLGARAAGALAAGCDLVLHCNGDMAEMRAVADAVSPLSPEAQQRLTRAAAALPRTAPLDRGAALARLDGLMAAA